MEEIKRMIEEAKRTGKGFSYDHVHYSHVYYSFTKEKLFSLLENVAKDAWGDDYLDEFNDYWQQLLKAIDN